MVRLVGPSRGRLYLLRNDYPRCSTTSPGTGQDRVDVKQSLRAGKAPKFSQFLKFTMEVSFYIHMAWLVQMREAGV